MLRRNHSNASSRVRHSLLPLPYPEQSLITRIALEHSLDDIKRVVCRKLGLADDLDVQLTQIRGNSSIALEDGNDIYHLLR